jgi:hypothetical protein
LLIKEIAGVLVGQRQRGNTFKKAAGTLGVIARCRYFRIIDTIVNSQNTFLLADYLMRRQRFSFIARQTARAGWLSNITSRRPIIEPGRFACATLATTQLNDDIKAIAIAHFFTLFSTFKR